MNLDKHFLRGIFGILLAAQYREGYTKYVLPVCVNELAKRVVLSAQNTSNQFLFINLAPPLSRLYRRTYREQPCMFLQNSLRFFHPGLKSSCHL